MKKCVAMLLTVLLTVSLCACGSGGSGSAELITAVYNGAVDESGDVYFVNDNGTVEKIGAEAYTAVKTKDRSRVVLLENDGTLNIVTGDTKTAIALDVRSISATKENALLYSRMLNQGKYYGPDDYSYENYKENIYSYALYIFATGEHIDIGEAASYKLSSKGTAVLYSLQNEDSGKFELRLAKSGVDGADVVGSGSGSVSSGTAPAAENPAAEMDYEVSKTSSTKLSPVGISEDGSVYMWAEQKSDGDEMTVYVSVNGEKEKIYSTDSAYVPTAYFNEAQDFAILVAVGSDTVGFWSKENGTGKVKLTNGLDTTTVYTDAGSFQSYPNTKATTFYVMTDEGANTGNLYAVSTDGNREKLASNVIEMRLYNGNLFYINGDYELYYGKLENGVLSGETRIADGANDLTTSPDGTAVVYARDVASDYIGGLYYFKAGQEKPVRIDSEAYCDYYDWSYSDYTSYYIAAQFSEDGKMIYFFTDPTEMDSGDTTATLMQYDVAKDTSVRIGSDILPSIPSQYVGSYVKASGFYYFRFGSYEDKEDIVFADLMFWNGENTSVLASDIVR